MKGRGIQVIDKPESAMAFYEEHKRAIQEQQALANVTGPCLYIYSAMGSSEIVGYALQWIEFDGFEPLPPEYDHECRLAYWVA